jgi:hypothetical protein
MPHANAKEAFVWQTAAPERARLLGAIAIAFSCGCLGILLGRWSVELAPARPPSRTAALIEAVSKETQAKPASSARPPDAAGVARPAAPSADPPAPEPRSGPAPGNLTPGPAPANGEGEASMTAGAQRPVAAPPAVPGQLAEAKPPAANEKDQLASETIALQRQAATAAEHRPALGAASVRPPARDYKALRHDLLSR